MKRDDHQPSTRCQDERRREQQRVNLTQLIVYSDAQRLKGSRRRMLVWLALWNRSGYHIGERQRVGELWQRLLDRSCDATTVPLLAVFPQNGRQAVLVEPLKQCLDGFASAAIHAHIERTCCLEGKASLGTIKL